MESLIVKIKSASIFAQKQDIILTQWILHGFAKKSIYRLVQLKHIEDINE